MTNEEGNLIIERLIKTNTSCDEQENRIKRVFPTDLNDASCMEKFKRLIARKGTILEYDDDWCVQLAILNSEDEAKLLHDCQIVKADLENDRFSSFGVMLDNKFKRNSQALRLIKKYCMQNEISWEIKKACDFAIFEG